MTYLIHSLAPVLLLLAVSKAGGSEEQSLRDQIEELARRNPAEAAARLQTVPEEALRVQLVQSIMSSWVASDPGRAAQFVQDMAGGSVQDAALAALLKGWVPRNAEAAVRWAEKVSANGGFHELGILGMAGRMNLTGVRYCRADALQLAGFEWAKRDERAALKWAHSIPDAEARERVVRVIERIKQSR